MNDLDWRNLWDLAVIEQEQRDDRLERERVLRDAGILPERATTRFAHTIGDWLVASGQRLGAEPVRSYAADPS